ncbi:MAG: LacI family DNA-binding transcriptional regulator [Spirochaetales bacterium]|nr:LacI family DNA-binding transcriptional regulator [Spirochaetales bacterium]
MSIIKELNYIPNNSARNLKRSSSKSIGIFVLGQYNLFFAEIIEVIEHEVSLKGYSAVIHFHQNPKNAVESAAQFVLEKKLAGLIYLGGVISKKDEGYIKRVDVPVVFSSTIVEEDVDMNLFSSVGINEKTAVNEVINYLVGLGHKKIALITEDKEERGAAQERFEVYKSALKNNGIEYRSNYIEVGDFSIKSGFECMKRLLKNNSDITAVFAVNDLMAIGAIKAVYSEGLIVPQNISVVGFDGLEFGEYYQPSLTTVKQPSSEFGKISTSLLFNLVETDSASEHIILDTKFTIRESCQKIIR